MKAILLHNKQQYQTGWVYSSGCSRVIVSGLTEDLLDIEYQGDDFSEILTVEKDGYYELPEETEQVRVNHREASGSPVFADLVE